MLHLVWARMHHVLWDILRTTVFDQVCDRVWARQTLIQWIWGPQMFPKATTELYPSPQTDSQTKLSASPQTKLSTEAGASPRYSVLSGKNFFSPLLIQKKSLKFHTFQEGGRGPDKKCEISHFFFGMRTSLIPQEKIWKNFKVFFIKQIINYG